MAFTFFMRDQPTLEQAAEHLIPYASGRSRIKIWDAGCAQGQETYTLAMILAERMNPFGFKNVVIHATDHDHANRFGECVVEGAYVTDELKRTPPELLTRYFRPDGETGRLRVVVTLRSLVRFQYHDLLSLVPIGEDFCLVICKNVLLHFPHLQRVEVFRMFHRCLAPGGYLATENTQKLPPEVAHLFTQVVPDVQLFRKVAQ